MHFSACAIPLLGAFCAFLRRRREFSYPKSSLKDRISLALDRVFSM